jgi:hypothetical protein
MSPEVVIEGRFRGPPNSANGGYACGMVAALVEPDPAVEVTLRAPPPLDTPLSAARSDGKVQLRDGETLLAEGRSAPEPELELPAPVTLEEAEAARRGSPLHERHSFPTCFVCGPDAAHGLEVVCGPVPGREDELVAAPFRTVGAMAGEGGSVRPELVWSVLDCPSGLVGMIVPDMGVSVLGRLTGLIHRPLETDRDYVAIGWPIDRDGRKTQSATAILDGDGDAVAVARATWIELAEQPAS